MNDLKLNPNAKLIERLNTNSQDFQFGFGNGSWCQWNTILVILTGKTGSNRRNWSIIHWIRTILNMREKYNYVGILKAKENDRGNEIKAQQNKLNSKNLIKTLNICVASIQLRGIHNPSWIDKN